MWRTSEHALARIDLAATKITYGTSHNRIRFDELVPDPRTPLPKAWARFYAHRDDPLTIWAFNDRRDELESLIED